MLYGKKIIPSTINGTYIWRLRNLSTRIGCIYIGIDNENGLNTQKNFSDSFEKRGLFICTK